MTSRLVESSTCIFRQQQGQLSVPGPTPSSDYTIFQLLPAPDGAILLSLPTHGTPPALKTVHWWEWKGDQWRERASRDRVSLNALIQRSRSSEKFEALSRAEAFSAWSPRAAFLGLRGPVFGRNQGLLLRIDGAAQPLEGSADDLVVLGQTLWLRRGDAFLSWVPGQPAVQYQGRTVTRLNEIFGQPEKLPILPLTLDPAWRLAKDAGEGLWLVSWDGRTLTPRAAWTGQTFRPASATELAAAAQGFVDAAGRLWRTADLPAGFRRDAWRTLPGLPRDTESATYTVDRRGRVWLTTPAGLAARWEQTRWIDQANRLPEGAFSAPLAAGPGVLVLVDGTQVCALE